MSADSPKPANDDLHDKELSEAMKEQTGKGGGGESNGGAYPNPHIGKETRGSPENPFTGGQSDNRYFGPGDAAGNSAKGADRDTLAGDEDEAGH